MTTQLDVDRELDPVVSSVLDRFSNEVDSPRSSFWRAVVLPVLIVVVVMCIGGFVVYTVLNNRVNGLHGQLSSAQDQGTANAIALNNTQRQQQADRSVANKLANQLKAHGISPSASVSSIPSASTVPVPGPAGRGIIAVQKAGSDLLLVFSDGTAKDIGRFVGPVGSTGPSGNIGRGIVSTTVSGTHLLVAYSDGQLQDVGEVVGPQGLQGLPGSNGSPGVKGDQGISVVKLSIDSNNDLQVLYSDGTTQNAGQLPTAQGPKGDPGYPPAKITISFTVGPLVTQQTVNLTCLPDPPAAPGAEPDYICTQN